MKIGTGRSWRPIYTSDTEPSIIPTPPIGKDSSSATDCQNETQEIPAEVLEPFFGDLGTVSRTKELKA